MEKFIYNKNFKMCGYSNHSSIIKKNDYDYTVRGIIFNFEKIIYIRLNNFNYDFINAKKLEYQFNKNLDDCINYLRVHYKGYKIYNSLTINKIEYNLKKEVLSC